MNDKKRITLNILLGVLFKIITLIFGILSTKFVISYLGSEINGLLALFTSIIGFLAIAELGVGTAITYSMYKPIIEKDYNKVSALYYLFRKFYLIIMAVILIVGSLFSFLVPGLATNYTQDYSIILTYLLFLISIVITYTYAHKTSTINAFKDNYITTLISSILRIIEYLIQILVLVLTKNFILFLLVKILISTIDYFVTSLVFRRKYKKYLTDNKLLDKEDKENIVKNITGMFMIRLGAVVILSTDNIMISKFISVGELGKYNVYATIITSMGAILSLIFIEITSILGHKNVKSTYKEREKTFEMLYYINFVLSFIFYLGYFAVADSLIKIIFSDVLPYNYFIIGIITLTFSSDFNRRSLAITKNSLGLFHEERHRPVIEGISNLILSLLLVKSFGLVGVLGATIITRLLVLYVIEPKVIYNFGFKSSPKQFYFHQYIIYFIQIISLFTLSKVIIKGDSTIKNFFINGFISVLFSGVLISLITLISPMFRKSFKNIYYIVKYKLIKRGDEKSNES